ncbi:MAG: SurA N-terminal domain-containing protein, partial [Ignavibacteriales bacterium]|nr:SurA N-terminal domain-containing protein [Ignavibacteriales bacterium]
MTKRYLLYFILFVYTTLIHAQSESSIMDKLAEIADKPVTVDEFQNRYEFMFPFKKQDELFSKAGKKQFLYSLISEKLWAAEAVNQGIDTLPEIMQLISQLQKFYMLDQFYKDSIESKIIFTTDELAGAIDKIPVTLFVQMLKSQDKNQIFNCYKDLHNGVAFDTLMMRMHGFSSPFPVVYGQLSDTTIENEVYQTTTGNYTKPLHADNQWMIIKIITREGNEHEGKKGNALKNIAELALRRRKGMSVQSVFLAGHFRDEKIEVA